jgi:hypothetical protein
VAVDHDEIVRRGGRRPNLDLCDRNRESPGYVTGGVLLDSSHINEETRFVTGNQTLKPRGISVW